MDKNRYQEESNLLRSHYYILRDKYDEFAVAFKVDTSVVYLHKNFRGYVPHKFTHQEFMSIIRVLGLRYFKLRCVNYKEILKEFTQHTDTITTRVVDQIKPDQRYFLLKGDNRVDFCARLVQETELSFSQFNLEELKGFNIALFGEFKLEPVCSNDPIYFQYDTSELNLIHFFKFVNHTFDADVANILQNCITAVFLEYMQAFELFKIHKRKEAFVQDITPTLYDFLTTNKIFDYIKNIASVDYIYTTPIR